MHCIIFNDTSMIFNDTSMIFNDTSMILLSTFLQEVSLVINIFISTI